MSERCETCRYWGLPSMPAVSIGAHAIRHCRRFPQHVTKSEDDWCGEWRAREAQASWLEREP